jgi:hypothetical protein
MSKLKEKRKQDSRKGTDVSYSESQALTIIEQKKKKWNSKQFKGTCHSCGKMGHKVANCQSKGKPDDKNKNANLTQRKCYHCNKMCHIAYQCPEKNKETGLVVFTIHDNDDEVSSATAATSMARRFPSLKVTCNTMGHVTTL